MRLRFGIRIGSGCFVVSGGVGRKEAKTLLMRQSGQNGIWDGIGGMTSQ